MKKLLSLLLFACFFLTIKAQAPEAFGYQAVLRDQTGAVIANEEVDVRIEILTPDENGSVVYSELFVKKTDKSGFLSLQIGTGATVQKFSDINWGSGKHYLRMKFRPVNASNYIELGTTQLLSVPYALYTAKSGEKRNLNLSGNVLSIEGGNSVTLPSGSSDNSFWSYNATDGVYTNNYMTLKYGDTPYFDTYPSTAGNGVLRLFNYNNKNTSIFLGGTEISTFSSNQNGLVSMGTLSGSPENGGVWVYGGGLSAARATLYAAKDNAGNSYGNLILRGTGNEELVKLTTGNNSGGLNLFASDGKRIVGIGGSEEANNMGGVWTYDKNGNYLVNISSYVADATRPAIAIYKDGDTKGVLSVAPTKAGELVLYGPANRNIVAIGSVDSPDYANSGGVWTSDVNGNSLVRIAVLNNYPNNASITLNKDGTSKGAFYVGPNGKSQLFTDELYVDGYAVLRATYESSVSESSELRSASQESVCYIVENDGSITLRGTASLVNGDVIISIPSDISEKINSSSITISLTPLSASSRGLAVVNKNNTTFRIKELMEGNGSYDFDWTLTALSSNNQLRAGERHIAEPAADFLKDSKEGLGKGSYPVNISNTINSKQESEDLKLD